ncbi:MAG: Flagellar rod assembly protein [Candidatus Tokpelaia sp. JSC189]|nr:MAG: Flagellar rod assembly protein [Candidatus Tokpelaia sp. JSC189]
MAITFPSDLVLDVARAADPVQYQASVQKLRHIEASSAAMAPSIPFSDMVQPKPSVLPAAVADGKKPIEVYRKFEAFMLQIMIQNMFTTDTPSVFGKGLGGEFWKSMLVEIIAREMVISGGSGIGVADMLESHRRLLESSQPSVDRQVV